MLPKSSLKSWMIPVLIVAAVLAQRGSDQALAFASKSASTALSSEAPSVWVTRPDGAQQCSPGSGQSLDASSAELRKAEVRVLGSQKGGDGKMRAQVCGIPSGKTNMFQIPKEDLSKAKALGFHEVKEAQ